MDTIEYFTQEYSTHHVQTHRLFRCVLWYQVSKLKPNIYWYLWNPFAQTVMVLRTNEQAATSAACNPWSVDNLPINISYQSNSLALWLRHAVVTGSRYSCCAHQCSIVFVLWSVRPWSKIGLGKAWSGRRGNGGLYNIALRVLMIKRKSKMSYFKLIVYCNLLQLICNLWFLHDYYANSDNHDYMTICNNRSKTNNLKLYT